MTILTWDVLLILATSFINSSPLLPLDSFKTLIATGRPSDLSATSVRDFLIPAIQNLLKDPDALDPAHKEAIEIILKERSGGTLEASSKVVGAHLGTASSVTSFFGEGGLLGKKEISEPLPPPPELVESSSTVTLPVSPAEDTRFRRIMRGNFTDMLRSKGKTAEDK